MYPLVRMDKSMRLTRCADQPGSDAGVPTKPVTRCGDPSGAGVLAACRGVMWCESLTAPSWSRNRSGNPVRMSLQVTDFNQISLEAQLFGNDARCAQISPTRSE
jgi:hypothetical protein